MQFLSFLDMLIAVIAPRFGPADFTALHKLQAISIHPNQLHRMEWRDAVCTFFANSAAHRFFLSTLVHW